MASSPTRISELTQVVPQSLDQIPIARGAGSGGQTLKITVGSLIDDIKEDLDDVTSQTIRVVDSPTIDLSYDSGTRTLSADLQNDLDLRTRNVLLPLTLEVPPGCIMPFAGNTPPAGWLACNGDIVPNTPPGGTSTISTSLGSLNRFKTGNFSRLHNVLGTTYGVTPGTLPDLRGYFVRGWDQGTGIDPGGRTFGTIQEDAFQGHKHEVYDPSHSHGGETSTDGNHTHDLKHGTNQGSTLTTHDEQGGNSMPGECLSNQTCAGQTRQLEVLSNGSNHKHTINLGLTNVKVLSATSDSATPGAGDSNGPGGSSIRVAEETRPKNFALLYCIKY